MTTEEQDAIEKLREWLTVSAWIERKYPGEVNNLPIPRQSLVEFIECADALREELARANENRSALSDLSAFRDRKWGEAHARAEAAAAELARERAEVKRLRTEMQAALDAHGEDGKGLCLMTRWIAGLLLTAEARERTLAAVPEAARSEEGKTP